MAGEVWVFFYSVIQINKRGTPPHLRVRCWASFIMRHDKWKAISTQLKNASYVMYVFKEQDM